MDMFPLNKDFEVVAVDVRDQIGSPFIGEAKLFLDKARDHLCQKVSASVRPGLAVDITNQWLEMAGVRDLVDEGQMLSDDEICGLTGMSRAELSYLEATAYAEHLGLEITDLEKAAIHYDIFGPHFPFKRDGGESFEWGGDLSAMPQPPDASS